MLRNKAKFTLVTDPEEWEGLGGCGDPVRRTLSERTLRILREVLRNKAEKLLVTDPEGGKEREHLRCFETRPKCCW